MSPDTPSPPAAPDPARPRTAVVLGGTSDIALAVMTELANRGLEHVVLAARDPEQGAGTLRGAAPGLTVGTLQWDALDIEAHSPMVDEVVSTLGRVDLVLCAVGALGHHAGMSMEPDDVDRMVRTNFAGPAAALSVWGRQLGAQGSGTIVVLSSVAGVRARKSNYVYGSSKSGLDAFAQGLGDALAGSGARVIVVRPGFVTSSMTEGLDPAPFHTDPPTVARGVAEALDGRREVVAVPAKLGPMFAVLRNLPRSLWRRIAADR